MSGSAGELSPRRIHAMDGQCHGGRRPQSHRGGLERGYSMGEAAHGGSERGTTSQRAHRGDVRAHHPAWPSASPLRLLSTRYHPGRPHGSRLVAAAARERPAGRCLRRQPQAARAASHAGGYQVRQSCDPRKASRTALEARHPKGHARNASAPLAIAGGWSAQDQEGGPQASRQPGTPQAPAALNPRPPT